MSSYRQKILFSVLYYIAMLPGLSIFVPIPVSTGHDMGVGMGSVSDPSYYNRTPHLVTSHVKMKT